mgnify:CR=1 FL=1
MLERLGRTEVGNIKKMIKDFHDENMLLIAISSPKNRLHYAVEAMGLIVKETKDGEKIPCLCFGVGDQIPYTEDEKDAAEKCEKEAEEQENGKKPPLGLMPRKLWDEKRANEIKAAINRYTKAGLEIPTAWVEEYFEIEERSKEE